MTARDPANGRPADDDPFGFDERERDEPAPTASADLGGKLSPLFEADFEDAMREVESPATADDPTGAQPAAAARAAAELAESMASLSRSIVGLWGRVEAAERAIVSLEGRVASIEAWARETRNLSRRAAGALHDLEQSQSER